MSYTAIGAVSASAFENTGTYCKAVTPGAFAAAEELQRQLNRCAYAIRAKQIAVDGKIGKDTVALANLFSNALSAGWAQVASCSTLTADVETWTKLFKSAADRNGAPSTLPVAASHVPAPGTAISPPPAPRAAGGGPLAWLGRRTLLEKVGIGVGGMIAVLAISSAVRGRGKPRGGSR